MNGLTTARSVCVVAVLLVGACSAVVDATEDYRRRDYLMGQGRPPRLSSGMER
jgi:hypothetical protein